MKDMITLFREYGFELSENEGRLFEEFLGYFREYNAHTNLSAIRDEEGIIIKHFIDSLSGVPLIQELFGDMPHIRMLDIGSGGGFPGIPIQIVLSTLQTTLLDSVGKKVTAMNFFIQALSLKHISAIKERAEILGKDPNHHQCYDLVVSRATAYITDILTWASIFIKKDGYILLYKMPSVDENNDEKKILSKLGLQKVTEYEYILLGQKRLLLLYKRK